MEDVITCLVAQLDQTVLRSTKSNGTCICSSVRVVPACAHVLLACVFINAGVLPVLVHDLGAAGDIIGRDTLAKALSLALDLSRKIMPDAGAMARNLGGDGGLIHAEALTFALARQMPRPEAAAAIKALTEQVRAGVGDLPTLAQAQWPGVDLSHSLGTAPDEARAFAARAQGQ
jgi:hypothetical protein